VIAPEEAISEHESQNPSEKVSFAVLFKQYAFAAVWQAED
jgi:hypothetical protein